MIHCIGDSHTRLFLGFPNNASIHYPKITDSVLPQYKVYVIPTTAWSVEKYIPTLTEIIEKHVRPGDSVLFSYGEIDCRVYIKEEAIKQGVPLINVVNNIVQRYWESVLVMKALLDKIPIGQLYLFGLRASGTPIGFYASYVSGSEEERNSISKEFNSCLSKLCISSGVCFIDIFDKTIDKEGRTRKDIFFEDGFHLNQILLLDVLEKIKVSDPLI